MPSTPYHTGSGSIRNTLNLDPDNYTYVPYSIDTNKAFKLTFFYDHSRVNHAQETDSYNLVQLLEGRPAYYPGIRVDYRTTEFNRQGIPIQTRIFKQSDYTMDMIYDAPLGEDTSVSVAYHMVNSDYWSKMRNNSNENILQEICDIEQKGMITERPMADTDTLDNINPTMLTYNPELITSEDQKIVLIKQDFDNKKILEYRMS